MKRRIAQFAGGLVLGVGLIAGVFYIRGFDPIVVAEADAVLTGEDVSTDDGAGESDAVDGDVEVEDTSENVLLATSPDTSQDASHATSDSIAAGSDAAVAALALALADGTERAGEAALDRARLIRILAVMKPAEAARIVAELDDADAATVLGALPDRKAALLLASLPPQKAAAIGRAALTGERSGH